MSMSDMWLSFILAHSWMYKSDAWRTFHWPVMASGPLKHNDRIPYIRATFWRKPALSMMPLRHLAVLRIYKNYLLFFQIYQYLKFQSKSLWFPLAGAQKHSGLQTKLWATMNPYGAKGHKSWDVVTSWQ